MDDENPRMIQLTRQLEAVLVKEPDRDIRFAALAINLAAQVAQIRIEDRGRCQHDIAVLVDKYVHKFAALR